MYATNERLVNLNRIFDQNKREGYLRLDLNENPGGLPQEFIDQVLSQVGPEFVAQYPETLEFTEVLADYLGTDITHLCLTNGSSEAIRYVIEAFTRPGGKIVSVTPTYAMFSVYSEMYGREFVPVTYTEDLQMPIERILEKLSPDTQLLILTNPNNPMGNVYTEEEFAALLDAADKFEITVLVDEAYHYFYPKTFIQTALSREHVFVTRTFSKLFSLAGCRLGYVAGWPEGIALVQKLCTPHNVNAFSMLFARTILQTPGMLDDMVAKQVGGKKHLMERLEASGYAYVPSEGNFIFIQPKTDAEQVVARMKAEYGILIKTYAGVGKLGNCLRVSTGEACYMDRFMDALLEIESDAAACGAACNG